MILTVGKIITKNYVLALFCSCDKKIDFTLVFAACKAPFSKVGVKNTDSAGIIEGMMVRAVKTAHPRKCLLLKR